MKVKELDWRLSGFLAYDLLCLLEAVGSGNEVAGGNSVAARRILAKIESTNRPDNAPELSADQAALIDEILSGSNQR